MHKLFLLIAISILYSCKEARDPSGSNLSTEKQEKSFDNKVVDSVNVSDLRSGNFMVDVEEFIASSSQIFDIEEGDIKIEIDTVVYNMQTIEKPNNIYLAIDQNASSYRQIELRYNRSFTVRLYELRFDNLQSAKKMFDIFKTFGMTRKVDLVPGLTYANDYVRLDKNSVYWLNSPCMVSTSDHTKLVEIFLKMLELTSISEEGSSMYCQCGSLFCTLSDEL